MFGTQIPLRHIRFGFSLWLHVAKFRGSLKNLVLKDLFLFAITAASAVQCGGPKKFPRTSSIVQITFFFRSFEISVL